MRGSSPLALARSLGEGYPSLPKMPLGTEKCGFPSSEGFMRDMNTNFVGAMNVTNAVLPHMRSRRDGTITFIGSRSAYRTMVVSTFFLRISRFHFSYGRAIQGTCMHHAWVNSRGLELTLLSYVQLPILRRKQLSMVRDISQLRFAHFTDPWLCPAPSVRGDSRHRARAVQSPGDHRRSRWLRHQIQCPNTLGHAARGLRGIA